MGFEKFGPEDRTVTIRGTDKFTRVDGVQPADIKTENPESSDDNVVGNYRNNNRARIADYLASGKKR